MNVKTTIGLLVLIGAVLVGGLLFTWRQPNNDKPCTQTAKTTPVNMVIKDGKVTPSAIYAKRCSRLSIVNQDTTARYIAFGNHDQHVAYDGVREKHVAAGQALTITLDKTGNYHWHDHDHEEVIGYFTVTR